MSACPRLSTVSLPSGPFDDVNLKPFQIEEFLEYLSEWIKRFDPTDRGTVFHLSQVPMRNIYGETLRNVMQRPDDESYVEREGEVERGLTAAVDEPVMFYKTDEFKTFKFWNATGRVKIVFIYSVI